MSEAPETVHGRLMEAVHISGYTFERACSELEWLLEEDRWKYIGKSYEHIDDFMASIDFKEFKMAIEKRKKLAKKLADLGATQRATGKMLGVNEATINRDVNPVANATKPKKESLKLQENIHESVADATPPPILLKSGAEVAKLAEKAGKKELKPGKERETDRIEILNEIEIRQGDFKEVLSDVFKIDTIITDPPYPHQFINCFSELSYFAKHHLKDDGFVAVYSGQYHLPEVIERLSEHLTYVWSFCLYHVGKKQIVNHINVMCGWKPVLIFSKGNKKMPFTIYDVLISEQREKEEHEWQQSESGVEKLIEGFSNPGELVVDPFAGSGTFGIVSHKLGRKFIGAEIK